MEGNGPRKKSIKYDTFPSLINIIFSWTDQVLNFPNIALSKDSIIIQAIKYKDEILESTVHAAYMQSVSAEQHFAYKRCLHV